MLGNKGNVDNVSAAVKPELNDLNVAEQQDSFANIDSTEKFEKLAKELNMSPKELRSAIDKGNINPKQLIAALNKVSKVPGVTIDKVKAQKEIDKAQIGKILDTAAKELGYSDLNTLVKDLPKKKTAGKTASDVINTVAKTGIADTQTYSQLKAPSFKDALSRRLDKVGQGTNLAA